MLSLIFATALTNAPPAPCAYDREKTLALAPNQFDQDMKGGWRPLGDKPACFTVAADLLAAYRKAHWATLSPDRLHLNYWHEGQLRATAGDSRRAIPLLLAGVNPEDDDIDFTDYALGTVAFLRGDRQGLLLNRARLTVTPQPRWWVEASQKFKLNYGHEPSWPVNLDVLDGLAACFDRPYVTAYDCRPKAAGAETSAALQASKP